MKEEMKKWMVEYKDSGDYGCAEEVEVYESEVFIKTGLKHMGEKIAVMKVQQMLLEEYDYMSRLVDVYEVEDDCSCDDCNPEWKLSDGTVLEQEYQDTLNDAMGSYTNSNGLTLEQAIEKASKRKK